MKKRHGAEQIVVKLREADVDLGKGVTVPEVCKLRNMPRSEAFREADHPILARGPCPSIRMFLSDLKLDENSRKLMYHLLLQQVLK